MSAFSLVAFCNQERSPAYSTCTSGALNHPRMYRLNVGRAVCATICWEELVNGIQTAVCAAERWGCGALFEKGRGQSAQVQMTPSPPAYDGMCTRQKIGADHIQDYPLRSARLRASSMLSGPRYGTAMHFRNIATIETTRNNSSFLR